MDNYSKQTPIDKEISINPSATFNWKISPNMLIDYANHHFCEISGFEEYELIGESIEKLRHPDMPKVILEVLYERLEKKEPMRLINKTLAKDGRYFWLMVDFETKVDKSGEVIAHYGISKIAPQYAVHKINALYKILSKIEEKTGGSEASKRYLIGFLEERNHTYNKYIEELSINHPEYEKPFQQQTFSQRAALQTETPPNTNFNDLSFDLSQSGNRENRKPAKKKSLLKKVFGK